MCRLAATVFLWQTITGALGAERMTADEKVASMVALGIMSIGDLPSHREPLGDVQVNHNRREEQVGLLSAASVRFAQPAGLIAPAAQRGQIADAREMLQRIALVPLVVFQEGVRRVRQLDEEALAER